MILPRQLVKTWPSRRAFLDGPGGCYSCNGRGTGELARFMKQRRVDMPAFRWGESVSFEVQQKRGQWIESALRSGNVYVGKNRCKSRSEE